MPAYSRTSLVPGSSRPAILDVMDARGMWTPSGRGDLDVCITVVRNADRSVGLWNDTLYLTYAEGDVWQCFEIGCTADPGLPWLKDPMNKKGTAAIAPGQYRGSHKIGIHRGKYAALVQRAPVKVFRDGDRNGAFDYDGSTVDNGIHMVNIHRSRNDGLAGSVGRFSAGCIVVHSPILFDLVMLVCKRASSLWGPNFTLTLLDERELSNPERMSLGFTGGAS